ncbi:MAG TPA: acetyl-CoA carboxylase biotin carboxylase subunit [Actinophytocola sp.]|uniref:acetyl-CoA carboxylase biotin carboxylase subunit n=1 Tax=Actinophytocola sp. TaxID=1872138 RepID=UPI002DDD0BED|nr:acetyl-CoA carboxylase biotin carboxylase subunit [Actinophytocola sp.]HEV2780503.1 acetyl-CoA carboxylase biotin carboxylase subunit [Actinophytocola sp.]
MFDKVLIANRGEIAMRVARACRELGIATVAVYSTEDRDSTVVSYADEAVHIGPGPAKRSYLHIPSIVEAAKLTGAQAVHPGYGFLSEDPDFAEVCAQNDLVFIGPPADVIASLGDKCVATRTMADAGLPILPGSHGPVAGPDDALAIAERTGFPVILKAAAGGGGRGMRVLYKADEVVDAYKTVSSEAGAIFGDSRLYLERYVASARHVEVQILADSYGKAIHLGVRECSVQRRHQKLLEESPAPHLPQEVIDEMGAVSVAGAKAVGYVGAGTFEFLVDERSEFYFMEANCRIQVEHPVTEMVTGIDLVQEQLRIAAGGRLELEQSDVVNRGWAVECRINMEDPDRSFAPAPGRIESLVLPGGPFVRVDTHGYPGYRVPAIYDPLLAKVITWAPTRDEAMARMDRALDEFRATGPGIRTTAGFLRRVLANGEFRSGVYDTGLVARVLGAGPTDDN